MKTVRAALDDIQPNPFRHIDRYRLKEDRVAELVESIETTDFWNNIVCRVVDGDVVQIAYGHHRLEALRRVFDGDHGVDLIVRDLSDEDMIRVMANENMEDRGGDGWTDMETVRAVVEAYADGSIDLSPFVPKDTPHDQLRFAPSLAKGDVAEELPQRPYTSGAILEFLRWGGAGKKKRIQAALGALSFIERGVIDEGRCEGLSTTQLFTLVTETRRTRKRAESAATVAEQEAERAEQEGEPDAANTYRKQAEEQRKRGEEAARRVSETLASEMVEDNNGQKLSTTKARKRAAELASEHGVPEPVRDINRVARQLVSTIDRRFRPEHDEKMCGSLDVLIENRDALEPDIRSDLDLALRGIVTRIADYAERLANEGGADTITDSGRLIHAEA